MKNVSGLKDNERQKALIARINARVLEGAHEGKPGETTMYFLDECMQLEAEGLAAQIENDLLRGLLAKGDEDCIYCGLPAADIAKCKSGFPGCARMDDIMTTQESREAQITEENLRLTEKVAELQKELDAATGGMGVPNG